MYKGTTNNRNTTTLDHTKYIHALESHTMHPERTLQKQDCLSPEEQTLFRKVVGQINWIVQSSRPDMAFEMIDLSAKLKQASICDLLHALKVVTCTRLKDMESIVTFPQLEADFKENYCVY